MDNYGYQHDENTKPFVIRRFAQSAPANDDLLVEVNSRSKLLKRPTLYKIISIIFIVISIVFLILLILLACVYFRRQKISKICTSAECLRSAANLRFSIDFDADPCDDFYKYACGRWSEEHPNHGWFATFSAFSTISERVLMHTESFLASEAGDGEPLPVRQSRFLYQSCLDTEGIDRLGYSVLFKYLGEVDLPLVPSMFTKTDAEIADFKFNWLRSDALIKKVFAMDALIGFAVEANSYNKSENVMYIGTPGQQCPLPSPLRAKMNQANRLKTKYGNEITYEELKRRANENIFKYVLFALIKNATNENPNPDKLQQAANALLNMTYYIDELVENYTLYDSYIGKPHSIIEYQMKTSEYLQNNINKNYTKVYEDYLDYLFQDTNVSINIYQDLFYISDFEYDYLPKILSYILTTSDIYLELYMWWITIFAMIINTTTDVADYIEKQTSPFYFGDSVLRSRSIECSSLVNTFMGLAVTYGIADRAFSNNTKPKVDEMLQNIKNAFVDRVNSISWMDSNTKIATLEKSKEMISFIGYPEWLFDQGALEIYYGGVEINPDNYLENMMNMTKLYMPKKLEDLRVVNERDWKTDPVTVNAFNSFSDNAINVPMAILTFPIYNLGLEYLNYGAIGSVLGHELTHGFDNTGRKHDKFGNYKQWWTNETIETFEDKTECFVKQYDNFTIDGLDRHVQGQKTLGENLADNGGLNHAFRAYQSYVKKIGSEQHLPGFETFSNEQLFFIAFGSIWCETTTLSDLESQLEYDEHCPNSLRVIGSLQNSKDFAKAFNCPVGSKMNPKSKCVIW